MLNPKCLGAGLWLALSAAALGAPVLFTVDAGSASTTTVSTASGKAVRQTVFSGQLPAEVVLHPVTRKPQGFRFEGGRLAYGDSVSQYTPHTPPASEELRFTSVGMAGPVSSVEGLPPVDDGTGLLGNADHFQSVSEGTLHSVYRQLIFGFWVPLYDDTIDFTASPQTNPLIGETRLTSEMVAAGPLLERHRLVLTHASDETPVVFTESGITLTTVTAGGFTARGETLVPSAAFHTWMVAAGAEAPISLETKLGSWPGAVLYALGLPEDARDLPWTLDAAAGTLTLHLPAGGTRVPLRAEQSSNLSEWQAFTFPGGATLLPAGTSGSITLPLPGGGRGFVRLAVSGAP